MSMIARTLCDARASIEDVIRLCICSPPSNDTRRAISDPIDSNRWAMCATRRYACRETLHSVQRYFDGGEFCRGRGLPRSEYDSDAVIHQTPVDVPDRRGIR